MRGARLHLFACAMALAVPWLSTPPKAATTRDVSWPTEFEGAPLHPVAMLPGEETLMRDFPGRMARFSDGRRHIVMRLIERDTRQVHHATECIKALGYDVEARPNVVDAAGRQWGAFSARRGDQRLLVRERFYEVDGAGSWTDVSAWYWAALLRRSTGPWWAVLVAEADPTD